MASSLHPSVADKRAVLLDALGTLVHLEAPGPALAEELADRGVHVTEPEAERAILAEIAYYRPRTLEGRDPASLAALRRRCSEVMRDALPPAAAQLPIEVLEEVMMASLRFRAFDDAPPALAALRTAGLRLVVVSNWDASLPEVLERVGLVRLVDGAVASAQVGRAKPAPELFARGVEVAGVGSGEVVHVGDSPVEDADGARAAGLAAVLLDRGANLTPPPGVPVVARLDELVGARP